MKVRYKKNGIEDFASRFNVYGLGEVILSDTSEFISELDVYLDSKSKWKDMSEAFRDHDIIVDNYNTIFFEPTNDADRMRGYTK